MSPHRSNREPSDRARHILRVLVERYIREGQPIGSRTLTRDPSVDLSPATVRNVMADLESMGLIVLGAIPGKRGASSNQDN